MCVYFTYALANEDALICVHIVGGGGAMVQVYIPTLSSTPFMADKLCRSVEDAKRIAAEHVLTHLPVPVDGLSVCLSSSTLSI